MAVLVRNWGQRGTIVIARAAMLLGQLLIPLASGPWWLALVLLLCSQLGGDWLGTSYGIVTTSMRQQHTPPMYLGRVNAAFQFLIMLALFAGTVLSGLLTLFFSVRLLLLFGSLWSLAALLVYVTLPWLKP